MPKAGTMEYPAQAVGITAVITGDPTCCPYVLLQGSRSKEQQIEKWLILRYSRLSGRLIVPASLQSLVLTYTQ